MGGVLMKRTALKRKTPMARGTASLTRSTPLTAGTAKKRRKISEATRREVAKRSGGRCVVCGRKDRRLTRHHVLPVQTFPELETVAANMVLVCWDPCHAAHENASRRIRWSELPSCAITLAYATSAPRPCSLSGRTRDDVADA
jgi:5-methylcytosine-specific restriction endonuclease McrA